MIYRRERPKCRKLLLSLCSEYDCTLGYLLKHPRIFLSDGLKKQARKMIDEGEFKTARELLKEQRTEHLQRSVGLIR